MKTRPAPTVVGALALAALIFPAARAESASELMPITDRNFTVDLHQGVVFGSPRLVAMGGAAFAIGEGATGLFANTAAGVVPLTKPAARFDWSVYVNSFLPTSGVDFNNNGDATNEYRRSAVYAPGLILQLGPWSMAAAFGYMRYEVNPQAGGGLGVRSLIPHLSVARHIQVANLTVGAGIRGAMLNLYTREGSNGLFTYAGASAEVGGVWHPRWANVRLALDGALPVYTGAVDSNCDPLNCFGYILPQQAAAPWILVLSGAYRFGRSRWNEQIDSPFRDERNLIVGVDIMTVGALDNAFSVEEFAARRLQSSGARRTYSPRLGAEVEALPGWIRLRAGSYFEPSRYLGVDGRLHGTGGVELRLLAFKVGSAPRRVSLQLAGDLASRYRNFAASVGFWN